MQLFAAVLFPKFAHTGANGFPQDRNPLEVPSRMSLVPVIPMRSIFVCIAFAESFIMPPSA
jgi:hypothetical protein